MGNSVTLKSNLRPQFETHHVSNFPQTNICTQFKAWNTFYDRTTYQRFYGRRIRGTCYYFLRIHVCVYCIIFLSWLFLPFFFHVSHFYVFFSCCLSSTSLKDLFFHSSSLFRILLISRASKKMKKIYLTNREERRARTSFWR